jgi:universal stress protein E
VRKLDQILVILDPQEEEQPALSRAAYLAEATGASLHLFMCAYDRAIGIASFLGGQKKAYEQTMVDGSQVLAERLAEPYRKKGLTITTEVLWDRHLVEAVVRLCEETEYDLVMKHARHQTRADAMFNHLDWNLMRYSPCPVMLVKTGQWDEVGQVLAAVDTAPESDLHVKLNKAVLAKASFLARVLDFELHLVSAYPPPPVYAPVSTAVKTQVNYRVKMRTMVEENLAEMADEYGVVDDRIHAIEGPVDWAISSVSSELVAEFVVMGNVSRQGSAGLSIGTTAETTLDSLNTNVLVVRVNED